MVPVRQSGILIHIHVYRIIPMATSMGLLPEEHHFVRTGGPVNPLPAYFVDNVITTGNTIRAARAALGWGTGLAYADASSPFNNRLYQGTASRTARPKPVEPVLQPAQ
jgi:hypothetical protein